MALIILIALITLRLVWTNQFIKVSQALLKPVGIELRNLTVPCSNDHIPKHKEDLETGLIPYRHPSCKERLDDIIPSLKELGLTELQLRQICHSYDLVEGVCKVQEVNAIEDIKPLIFWSFFSFYLGVVIIISYVILYR